MVTPLLDYVSSTPSDGKATGGDALALATAKLRPLHPVVIIATVADPIDSGLYYYFDQALEAIRLAFDDAGRFRDRSWLPWVDVQTRTPDESRDCRKLVPGVILFRGKSDLSGPTVLLVVGETPTAGIHKAALTQALDLAAALQERPGTSYPAAHAASSPRQLALIGPTFSGSATSLRHALAAWDAQGSDVFDRYRIISGTATGDLELGQPPRITFQSTNVRDRVLHCALFKYLAAAFQLDVRDVDVLEGVALLAESATEFGAGYASRSMQRQSTSTDCLRPEIHLRFPPHISSIRTAYDALRREQGSGAADAVAKRFNVPRARLDPSLDEPGDPRDIEPPTSPKTTTTHDLELATLFQEIARRNVRYVGIVATDVSDIVFLAQHIRIAAPDIRIFTFASESLFMHPAYASALNGMLVASAYPFFGLSDYGGDLSSRQARLFSGEFAESTFNASLAALAPDSDVSRFAEYTIIDGKLPVWISVVGNGRLWPLATSQSPTELLFRPERCDSPAVALPFPVRRGTPPTLWLFVFALVMLLNVYNWLGYRALASGLPATRAEGEGPRATRAPRPPLALSPLRIFTECSGDLKMRQSHYSFVARAVLAVVSLYLSVIHLTRALDVAKGASRTNVLRILAVAAVLLVVIGCWWRFRRKQRALVLCTAVAAVLLIALLTLMKGKGYLGPFGWATLGGLWAAGACVLIAVATLASALRSFCQAIRSAWRQLAGAGGLLNVWSKITSYLSRDATPDRGTAVQDDCAIETGWRLLVAAAMLAPVLILTMATAFGWWQPWTALGRELLVERAVHLTSGVSPVVPILIAGACVYVWAICHLHRLRLIDEYGSPWDFENGLPLSVALGSKDIEPLERGLLRALANPGSVGRAYGILLFLAAGLPVALCIFSPPLTVELVIGRWTLVLILFALSCLTATSVVRLLYYWVRLRMLLGRVAHHPVAAALERLPPPFAKRGLAAMIVEQPRMHLRELEVPVQLLRKLRVRRACAASWGSDNAGPTAVLFSKDIDFDAISQEYEENLRAASEDWREAMREPGVAKLLLGACRRVRKVLEPFWSGSHTASVPAPRPAQEHGDIPGGPAPAKTPLDGANDDSPLGAYEEALDVQAFTWLKNAEEFVGIMTARALQRLLQHFRHFVTMVTAGGLFLLLIVSTYVFHPRKLLLTTTTAIIATVVTIGLYLYFQLDRDEVLCRLAGTAAGRITWNRDLIGRVFTWGILPLLGVVAAQYPEAASVVFAWFRPFISAAQ